MMRTYHSDKPFELESGDVLPGLDIAYHTFGELNERRDNAVWVCHALTANSDVADWWPGTVETGRFLDPAKHFTVCANIIGSCYGSTGPLSVNPATGEPWYGDFPPLTIRDMARVLALLADELGLDSIDTIVGASVGGFQALEWAAEQPWRFKKLILIATAAEAMPWTIAIDESQRMAIKADSSWGERRADAAGAGLAAARAIGLLTYRGGSGYNATQTDPPAADGRPVYARRACSYQRHQGEKLRRRFSAYSYVTILDAFDTHDIGRGRGGIRAVLSRIEAPALVIGITTDIIFPPDELRDLACALPRGRYKEIESRLGHDGFLVENDRLNALIQPFMND